MILEDIPIFYLASKNFTNECYWGFTGNSSKPQSATNNY